MVTNETSIEICLVYRQRTRRLLVTPDTLRHPNDLLAVVRTVQEIYGQRHPCKVFRIEGDVRIPLSESSEWSQWELMGLEESSIHPNTRSKNDIAGVGRLLCERYKGVSLKDMPPEEALWMQHLESEVKYMTKERRRIWKSYLLGREKGQKIAQTLNISSSTVSRYAKEMYTWLGQATVDHWGWHRVWEILQEPMPRSKKREKPRQS
ncbi:hypothetical protein [Alicyclobacillus sp. SP_1]|jgi:hypothetical protein|uniref:hypothetical protein n=1 Tax=Alicyclobacillus sp. SP_1 TaxID=2942475 RepID=UPI0021577008|nr:hypothetical protein [Alicyclobacillus sp. SP_1]